MQGKILFGRYEILEPLGQGGFSSTYIAKDLQEGFRCVVKHLCLVSNNPGFVQEATRLFQKEAETLKKLNGHPQIPRIFNYFQEQEQFYLIQELIQGQTLSSRLSGDRPWSEFEVVEFLKDALEILEYIHSRGVIHRDIKPDNLILRQQDSKFVLIDFGSVKEFQPQQSQLVSPTIAIGTKGYMPLEQIKGHPRKNSDLYALGMIAIQALTGYHPMDLEENAQGELIWQTHAQVSLQLAEILQKMIAPDFRERYQSARAVLEDLDRPSRTVLPPTASDSRIPDTALPTITPMNGKFSTWLKSPAANNIGIAFGLAITATLGIYYLGAKEKADKLVKIKETVAKLESDYKSEQFDRCFEESQSEETKAIEIPETTLHRITVDCGLGRAEVLAKQSKFGEALEKLDEIPTGTEQDSRITKQADIWSQGLLVEASRIYGQEGNLSEALEMLGSVPANSQLRSDADSLAQEWKAESERFQAIVKKAEFALETENYEQVIEYAKDITHANPAPSEYWLLQGKDLAEKAQKGREKNSERPGQGNPRDTPATPPPVTGKNDPLVDKGNPGIEVPPEFR